MRVLLDSISGNSHIDLRDKALIGLMLYSFARIERSRRDEGGRRIHTESAHLGAAA